MMSQLTFSMITLLVLFSTLCPAGDRVEVHQVKFSCPLSGRWNAVCIQQPPSLNVVLPTRWVDAAHSLESAVQVLGVYGSDGCSVSLGNWQHHIVASGINLLGYPHDSVAYLFCCCCQDQSPLHGQLSEYEVCNQTVQTL